MKKIIYFAVAIIICCSLTSCFGKTENVERDAGASERFSAKEVERAMDVVLEKFKITFFGCEMTNIWYNEDVSAAVVKSYLENGNGILNNATAENTIVILSNFYVDNDGAKLGLSPNSVVKKWSWILIRENVNSRWKVDAWGY